MKNTEFILTENCINGIEINDLIREEELHEFSIVHRDSFIDDLIMWISEATRDKQAMKQDLKMLMDWDDEYILTSNSTNYYLGANSPRYEEVCLELLELNANINKTSTNESNI